MDMFPYTYPVKKTGLYDNWLKMLKDRGQATSFGGVMPNSTYAKVQEGASLVRGKSIGFILAVGGRSVSDCRKQDSG